MVNTKPKPNGANERGQKVQTSKGTSSLLKCLDFAYSFLQLHRKFFPEDLTANKEYYLERILQNNSCFLEKTTPRLCLNHRLHLTWPSAHFFRKL